jgi:hypothetical protein
MDYTVQAITKVFQDIVTERTTTNTTTPMQTDFHKFSVKRIAIVQETILDAKTGLLTGLLAGKQGWKCPVALVATC